MNLRLLYITMNLRQASFILYCTRFDNVAEILNGSGDFLAVTFVGLSKSGCC